MLRNRATQSLTLQPSVGEQPVRIAVGTITQDSNDRVTPAQLLRHFLRGHHIQRGASTEVQTLLIQAAVDHLDRLLVRDVKRSVQQTNIRLQVIRDTALANTLSDTATGALNQVPATLDIAVQHTARRIGKETLNLSITDSLQVARDTSQSTTGTRSTSESVNLTVRLRPDLRTSRLDMRLAVGGVVELVRPDGVVQGLGVPTSLVVVVLRVVECDGGDGVDFGTEETQQVDLALRLGVRHVDDQLVALGAADVGESDSGVSCRAFHHRTAGLQESLSLRILDDE